MLGIVDLDDRHETDVIRSLTFVAGLAVIAAVIAVVVRGVDVRLVLLLAERVLGCLAGQPQVIVQQFLTTLINEPQ